MNKLNNGDNLHATELDYDDLINNFQRLHDDLLQANLRKDTKYIEQVKKLLLEEIRCIEKYE